LYCIARSPAVALPHARGSAVGGIPQGRGSAVVGAKNPRYRGRVMQIYICRAS